MLPPSVAVLLIVEEATTVDAKAKTYAKMVAISPAVVDRRYWILLDATGSLVLPATGYQAKVAARIEVLRWCANWFPSDLNAAVVVLVEMHILVEEDVKDEEISWVSSRVGREPKNVSGDFVFVVDANRLGPSGVEASVLLLRT